MLPIVGLNYPITLFRPLIAFFLLARSLLILTL